MQFGYWAYIFEKKPNALPTELFCCTPSENQPGFKFIQDLQGNNSSKKLLRFVPM